MKKVMFFLVGMLSLLALFDPETTFIMMIPVIVYLILEYLNIWKKVKNGSGILALAIAMIIVNIYAVSIEDIIVWALIIWAHREVI